MKHHFHIWDLEERPERLGEEFIFWRIFDERITSIPNLIEKNSDILRARYLKWVFDIGNSQIDGKTLLNRLRIRENFSFWWMNLISEKCNYAASPQITEAIRLLAFDMWMSGKEIDSLELSSGSQSLRKCLKIWCDKRNVKFIMNAHSINKQNLPFFVKIYSIFPHALKAISQLSLYAFKRWPLKGVGLDEWKKTEGHITFFSYLLNLNPNLAKKGKFASGFWPKLPEDLRQKGTKVNWLHIFCEDPLHPNSTDAARVIENLNKQANAFQVHVCLDSFLSLKLCYKTVIDWLQIIYVSKNLEKNVKNVTSNGLNLWPLYQSDWRASLFGSNSILNLLTLNLLEAATKALPPQKTGFYLYEQQPWELALIYAWKQANHGQIVGSHHSTMLYWDMRYYHDPRTYYQSGKEALPMPDLVTVNGPEIMSNSIISGYPKSRLIEVEALRFLYLQDLPVKESLNDDRNRKSFTLLIVSDYLFVNTDFQLNLLSNAMRLLPRTLKIILKPHPNLNVDPSKYPEINFTITKEPLVNILSSCDIVYASSVTSAAVDAYCAGKPVLTALNPNNLNMSPLRNCKNTFFVNTPEQIAEAFKTISSVNYVTQYDKNFFTLDKNLPRWKELITELTL